MDSKRRSLIIALALPALCPTALRAQQQRPAFTELKPAQPTEAAGKIEVIEFFWYGCIHCFNLEPHIEAWAPKLAPDVQFRRVPAVFNERWALDAAHFHTFEALGVLEKVHRPLFDAVHKDRLRTDNPQAFAQFLDKHGIDAKKYMETQKSFGVQSRVKRSQQQTIAYKIDGTPAMAVQGRFTVSADQGGSGPGMLRTIDYLVDQVRKQK